MENPINQTNTSREPRPVSNGTNENTTQNLVQNSPETKQGWYQKPFIKDILSFAAIIVFVVIPFRIFIAQPYLVDGSSMDPTFKSGEYLIVDQLSFRLGEPERGDVIVFRFPLNPKEFFIKRVIGLPNETVLITPDGVMIKNKENPEGMMLEEKYVVFKKTDSINFTLKENEYFVMGDNRGASADSRLWGAVPRKNIMGKPFVALFPIDKIRLFPGSLSTFTK